MISFSGYLTEARQLKNLNDAKGKLFEILSGSYLQHGHDPETNKPNKFLTHFRDENGNSPEQIHDDIKRAFPEHYEEINRHAKTAAEHLTSYLKENGHDNLHEVAWTSQPSDHESFTGEQDPKSDADLMFISKTKEGKMREPVGVSLKYGKQSDPNLRNQGMAALESMAGLEENALSDLRNKHYDFLRERGISPGVAGDSQYKQMVKEKRVEEHGPINEHALETQRKMASTFSKGMQNKSSDEIRSIVSDIIAPETKFEHIKLHTRPTPSGGLEHHVSSMREHTNKMLDQYEEYRMRDHDGGISSVIEGRRPGSKNFEPAVQIGFKKSRTFSGHGFASFTKAPMLRERAVRTVKNASPEESGSGQHGPVDFHSKDELRPVNENIQLTEADAAPSKQTHLEHIEDLAYDGHDGVGLADQHLRQMHNYLLGAKRNTPDRVETKVDGAPAFHIFKDNEGRIGVGTKSMFNKNPKLNFTDEDIDANHGHAPGLAAVLKQVLSHAHKMVPSDMKPGEIYKGDFLFGDGSSGRSVESGDDFHEFQPNTLRYKVPKDSPEGARIGNAKVGVALHTYFGPDGIAGPIDKKRRAKLLDHPDVFNYDPYVQANPVNHTPVEQRAFEEHMENARKAYNRIKPEVYDDLTGHDQHMRTYTNKRVREGGEGPGNVDEYLDFLNQRAQKDIDSVKTQAAKDRKTKQHAALMQQVVQNAKHVQNIFDLHNHLQNAKNVLIGVAGKNSGEAVELPDGSATGHEGYVSTIKTDGGQHQGKFVDRAEFSRANFAQGSFQESVKQEEKTSIVKKLVESFFLTESIRQGLPHITTMTHDQFSNLTKGGKVNISSATEKTDGSVFMIGHDDQGFYSQSSGSGKERMRNPEDYAERAKRRSQETGKPLDLTGANAFAKAHAAIQKNKPLLQHLQTTAENSGGETQVRGELFSRALSRPSETPGEIKFVGTSYDSSHMGSVGKFVIHTKLPENQGHDHEKFKREFSTPEFNFDDDKIEGFKPSEVDVSKHLEGMKDINTDILKARKTKKNADVKAEETAKFEAVKQKVSEAVDKHVKNMNLSPKWGSGSEGLVVHPEEGSDAPRFKVTSDAFRQYKASDDAKNFKKRTPIVEKLIENFYDNSIVFKYFITEGGNIKVKDSEGNEVSAAPFAVKDRTSQSNDVYDALRAVHDSFVSETGNHLFGKNAKALSTGSAYSGSTRQFMNKDPKSGSISDKEFKSHKPTVGDVDVQVPREHKESLHAHLTSNIGNRFGKYTLVGIKKSGNETHAVMRHDNGEHHQFDFEHVTYQGNEPAEHEQFLHSSSWEDSRNGIKGAHHKILLNAVASASDKKFSITHGLRSRTNVDDPGVSAPKEVSKSLFGPNADHERINSFIGIADSIKKHIPSEKHQEIYDKFKNSMANNKNVDSKKAIAHLKSTLSVKD